MKSEQRAVTGNKPHRNLIAWQKTMDLAVVLYEITKKFPEEEIYGLTGQLRRAAVSVPSNIAEVQQTEPPDNSLTSFRIQWDRSMRSILS